MSVTLGKKIFLFIFVMALSLGAAEIVLRMVAENRPNIVFKALGDHMKTVHLEFFNDVIENDPETIWRLAPHKVLPPELPGVRGLISNGDGLREDHEIPREKPRGQIRILFAGDSCTFGFGMMHDQSYVDITEKMLRKRFPGVNVECINAGVPGYTMMQGWRYIESYGIEYNPDLIVVQFGWNDSKKWTSRDDLETYEDRKNAAPPSFLAHSEICRQLWFRIHHPPDREEPVYRVNTNEYLMMMDRIHKLADQRRVEFLPIVWPVLKNFEFTNSVQLTEYQKITYSWGSKAKRFGPDLRDGFIDLIPAFQQALFNNATLQELFMDGVHVWPQANELIAKAIVDYLSPWFKEKATAMDL